MRRRMNSLATIAIVMPAFFRSANLAVTCASRGSTSFTCCQPGLGFAGAAGVWSRGLYAAASTYTHCFLKPSAFGWSSVSRAMPAVVSSTQNDTHPVVVLSRQDVLVRELRCEAIATRWRLERGWSESRDASFTQVRPLTVEVKAYILLDCY